MQRFLILALTVLYGGSLYAADSATRPTKELTVLAVNLEKQRDVNWKDYRFLSFDKADTIQRDKAGVKMVLASLNATNNTLDDIIVELAPTIWGINVKVINWPADAWEDMSKEWVYYSSASPSLKRRLKGITGSEFPLMRADVFVEDAWASRWYERFLRLPKTRAEMFKARGIDLTKPVAVGVVSERLSVTQNPGKVARYLDKDGRAVWIRMNYEKSSGKSNCRQNPHDFTCQYNEVAFQLPCGLDAFASFDGDNGKLSRFSDTKVATDRSGGVVELGKSCFECHRSGARSLKHVDDPSLLKLVSDPNVRRLYDKETIERFVTKDRERWAAALYRINGLTPAENNHAINGLQKRFRSSLKLEDVAREFGVAPNVLKGKLEDSGNKAFVELSRGEEWTRAKLEEHYPDVLALFRREDNAYMTAMLR